LKESFIKREVGFLLTVIFSAPFIIWFCFCVYEAFFQESLKKLPSLKLSMDVENGTNTLGAMQTKSTSVGSVRLDAAAAKCPAVTEASLLVKMSSKVFSMFVLLYIRFLFEILSYSALSSSAFSVT